MKGLQVFAIALILTGCAGVTGNWLPNSKKEGPRTITLAGKSYSEEKPGDFISWVCHGFVDEEKTLVEVGNFSAPDLHDVGFVIYDGGDSGDLTNYQRKGINLRWDWGPEGNNFAFVLKPDGTGLFYDFSGEAKAEKANQVFKCRQR